MFEGEILHGSVESEHFAEKLLRNAKPGCDMPKILWTKVS